MAHCNHDAASSPDPPAAKDGVSDGSAGQRPRESRGALPTGVAIQCCHHHHHHHGDGAHGTGFLSGERIELGFAIASAVFLSTGYALSWLRPDATLASHFCYALAYFFGGYFAAVEAVTGLTHRVFAIDSLMVAAAIGAAILGHYAEGALLLTLFSLGHAAEHYAMGRAQRSIGALSALRPTTATVIDPATERLQEVDIADLVPGDRVLVRPDERIAADGVIVEGMSSVDQAPITGESIPVDKSPVQGFDPLRDDDRIIATSHKVFAGTINGGAALQIVVTRAADDMTLARLIRLITEAKTRRSPTQRLTESFERLYVPSVLIFVAVLLFAFLVVNEPPSASFYRAMAVLVAASPCALAISTPSAVLSAIARGGREGVLIKGGGPLEELGRVTTIAFDKTGTLTRGKPELVEILPHGGVAWEELLRVAAAVEQSSHHPLARAIVSAAEQRLAFAGVLADPPITNRRDPRVERSAPPPSTADSIESLTGSGIRARLEGLPVCIGNVRLFEDAQVSLPPAILESVRELESAGRTVMIVRHGDAFLGVLGLLDTPRNGALDATRALRQMGIKKLIMLSGDNQPAANAIAQQVGLDEAHGGLMPEEKLAAISRYNASEPTAMIGDGVNDAPAMAAASVSIAMGAAASDVALETADVALMSDDLGKLPFAIGLGRQASRIIRQNLWISLGMIAVLVPASVLGLRLAVAVVFHEGSTLLVVLNALRLLRYRQ